MPYPTSAAPPHAPPCSFAYRFCWPPSLPADQVCGGPPGVAVHQPPPHQGPQVHRGARGGAVGDGESADAGPREPVQPPAHGPQPAAGLLRSCCCLLHCSRAICVPQPEGPPANPPPACRFCASSTAAWRPLTAGRRRWPPSSAPTLAMPSELARRTAVAARRLQPAAQILRNPTACTCAQRPAGLASQCLLSWGRPHSAAYIFCPGRAAVAA